MTRLVSIIIICLFGLSPTGPALAQAVLPQGVAPIEFGQDTMVITTDQGRYVYDVEVAVTKEQQARGLMWRPVLGPNKGMIFILETERNLSFWMRNTLIPLDMVFIDNAGKLVSIQRDATPLSKVPLPSGGPARIVLEIDGGDAAILNINDSTRFEFGAATLNYLAASRLPFKG